MLDRFGIQSKLLSNPVADGNSIPRIEVECLQVRLPLVRLLKASFGSLPSRISRAMDRGQALERPALLLLRHGREPPFDFVQLRQAGDEMSPTDREGTGRT